MGDHNNPNSKPVNVAWRVSRVILQVIGRILLILLIAVGTLALVVVVAGSIFMSKFSDYLKDDTL